MPDRLPLLGRPPITYSSAIRKNYNVLREVDYIPAIKNQYTNIWAQRRSIEALVRHHLRLRNEDACAVLDPQVWIQGAFNVCVLVEVTSGDLTTKFVFRCPKPYRLFGIVDEKLSSEVGANIFVDEDWNVKCLIDLEWICALPVEMLDVPYWLTGCSIEEICGEEYNTYDKVRQEFMDVLEKEEHKSMIEHGISISRTMEEMWDSKGVWFWHCLTSVDAMNFLLEDHLCPPRCLSSEVERAVSEFWCDDAGDVVKRKLADKAKYEELLKSRFA
ncbi:hypothetical protein AK830_g1608 [Neonectria ditissima]|uniref:Aminoglycoside phosphotransferase domain-containing protein n=1 Tax=Neonectria ditissima TaxID=78410 RepID=A0A0P7BU06_9HYPO|nr:hypothetical protein AK830_g1608 [Neonectria ditissima]